MELVVNGKPVKLDLPGDGGAPMVVSRLLEVRGVDPDRIALAVNGQVIPKDRWGKTPLREGDEVDIVHAVGGGQDGADDDPLVIAGEKLRSRLILGTGKYPSPEVLVESLRRSGTAMVTVALRQMNLEDPEKDAILPHLELDRYRLLPNTAGAYTVEQAVKLARLGREATGTNWVKLEVIGDPETLWPDVAGTVEATRILVKEGFTVLPYTSPDIVAALRLEDAGAATVMPLASLIGSGRGFIDWESIQRIVERVQVPVIVDAGIGSPSDAAFAMEIGCDAVLLNTAVARAKNPPLMAEAMANGVKAGRACYLAGRIPRGSAASPSSPTTGVVA